MGTRYRRFDLLLSARGPSDRMLSKHSRRWARLMLRSMMTTLSRNITLITKYIRSTPKEGTKSMPLKRWPLTSGGQRSRQSNSVGTWIIVSMVTLLFLPWTIWMFGRRCGITIGHDHMGYFLKDEWGHNSSAYSASIPRIKPLKNTTQRLYILRAKLLQISAGKRVSFTRFFK